VTADEVTVSAKIPRALKEELDRRGVKVSDAIKRGLRRELKELRVKELEDQMKKGT